MHRRIALLHAPLNLVRCVEGEMVRHRRLELAVDVSLCCRGYTTFYGPRVMAGTRKLVGIPVQECSKGAESGAQLYFEGTFSRS
ncbi:hypothetical protein DFH09DRAFT_1151333 [Mycena vulgaris]|nr:hypothetical protein DFH09DRAFT_1151333 [Mycena vulgaris]